MTDGRPRRDWTTPVLLTLSVHLLAFTLFVNHRMFALLEQPRVGAQTLKLSALTGDDPDEDVQEGDAGAAPGPAEAEPQAASVADLVRESVPLPPMPAIERETPAREAPEGQTLADRLAKLRPTGDSSPGPAFVAGGGSHGLRGQGRHGEGLRRNGGSGETEDAVEMALAWLASVQDLDGRWDSDGYMVHYLQAPDFHAKNAEGVGGPSYDVGITGLCLLTFTGAGYMHTTGRYAQTVRRAMEFLKTNQRPEDGGFGFQQNGTRPGMYGHCIASLALCDLYLQSGDQRLRPLIERAIEYLLRCQGRGDVWNTVEGYGTNWGGGWNYVQELPEDRNRLIRKITPDDHISMPMVYYPPPRPRHDLSITGWAVLALVAAREAGIGIPRENLERLVGYLQTATTTEGEGIYADQGERAGARGLSMMAVSNLSRRLLGEPVESDVQKKQLSRISANPPDWFASTNLTGCNEYFWYYGTLAMLLGRDAEGGENRWREWNGAIKKTLLSGQCKAGPRKGSFDPIGFWAQNGGGRLYMTALCVLNLEIYYRYEPEYLRVKSSELAWLWK